MTESAIKAWQKHKWLGVGLGSAGQAISKETGGWEKEIIQNEYINILTELGLIGAVILISMIIFIICETKKVNFIILAPVIVGYLITLAFFSGFPNVLHLYLLTPVIYSLGQKRLLC